MTDPRLRPRPCNGRQCDALIAFVLTEGRRLLPIDLEPTPTGNVELTPTVERAFMGTVDLPVAIVHAHPTLDDGDRYLPHFVTCPNAADFRRTHHPRP